MNLFSAAEDNFISYKTYINRIEKELGKPKVYPVSLESGFTWQFHIGRIDELSEFQKIKTSKTRDNVTVKIFYIVFNTKLNVLIYKSFWITYLKECDIHCCLNQISKNSSFSKMDDLIIFLRKNMELQSLTKGRIKGDFSFKSRKYSLISFEYRDTYNGFNWV